MIDDERDSFDSVLLVGVSGDDEVKLRMGNPASMCLSYDIAAADGQDPVRCDLGFRSFADFQRASKKVDLVFFGSNTPATAIGSVISLFAQDDAVIVTAPTAAITGKDLLAVGCGNGRVLTLRRMGDVQVVGYEVGGDLGTRMAAKLVSEFVEPLGRVVFGAELVVSGTFKKPETLVGPHFIVAVEGAQFPSEACNRDSDLVAVDLGRSGMRKLSDWVFECCSHLAAVAFPAELATIGGACFRCCTALEIIDLAATTVEEILGEAFADSGVVRVSLPASLREVDLSAFWGIPLASLDLGASASLAILNNPKLGSNGLEMAELGLPREGFAALAEALLPGSPIEVLHADVDASEIEQLLPRLDEWGIDRLRVVSPRVEEPFEWVGWGPRRRAVAVFDPEFLTTLSAVTLTVWRSFPKDQRGFVRSIDLSAVDELPRWETLSGSFLLESVILPARSRVLPSRFVESCPRLSNVETAGCGALEAIQWYVFEGCRSLREFVFPSMIRMVRSAFGGTSISCLDLSATRAESILVGNMKFLMQLVLPRRCLLRCASGLPALRSVTLGSCGEFWGWNPREVRFESLAAPAKGGPLAATTCVFAEVACILGRESFPFPP
jgi:SAM-dependent methyltransferase